MIDFVKIKVVIVNKTSSELKMIFGQYPNCYQILFKIPSRRLRLEDYREGGASDCLFRSDDELSTFIVSQIKQNSSDCEEIKLANTTITTKQSIRLCF